MNSKKPVTLYVFLPLAAMALLVGKLGGVLNFIIGRIVSWTGMAYFFRRSKQTGKRRYKWAALLIYVVSWLTVIIGYGYLLVALWKKFGG